MNIIMSPTSVETHSGLFVDTAAPDVNTIVLSDIAWATSRLSRFAGHSNSEEIWSVAQHEIFTSELIATLFRKDNESYVKSFANWVAHPLHFIKRELELESLAVCMLHGLVHDSQEAYLVDLPSPVKKHPLIKEPYGELERVMQAAIYAALKIPSMTEFQKQLVHWADMLALRIEAHILMPSRGVTWSVSMPELPEFSLYKFPKVLHWKEVYHEYLEHFSMYYDEVNHG